MKLEPEDYPLIVQENRVYTQRKADEQVFVAIDHEMAMCVADRLNKTADVVFIREIDLSDPAQVERFLRDRKDRQSR